MTRLVGGRGPILELIILPFWAVLLIGILTPFGMASSGDPYVFFGRAVDVLAGLVPFRDFGSEYPPLSLLPMTLPHLWPNIDQGNYFTLLNAENGLLASAVALTVLWLARRSWSSGGEAQALAIWAVLILLMAPLAAWRFDLAAVLLVMIALMAAARERPGTAGVLLGLGALMKIFPIVVVPILAIRCLANGDGRGAVRLVGACLLTGGLIMLPLLLAAGANAHPCPAVPGGPTGDVSETPCGALTFIEYQFARGLQVESGGGGLVLLAHMLGQIGAGIGFSHYSFEAASPVSATVVRALTPLTLALFGLLFLLCWLRCRTERRQLGGVQNETVVAYLAATLLILLLTNKVFSPQYLLWMLPLGALLRRRHAYALMVACVLTIAIFPLNYDALLHMAPEMVVLLNARNLLLLAIAAWLVAGHLPRRRLPMPPTPASGMHSPAAWSAAPRSRPWGP